MTLDKKVDLNSLIDIMGGHIHLDKASSDKNWRHYSYGIESQMYKGRDVVVFYAERLRDGSYQAELLIKKEDFENHPKQTYLNLKLSENDK